MTITIKSVSSPTYAREDKSLIDVLIDTVEYGELPCTLWAEDTTQYLRDGAPITNGDLFHLADSGEFGALSPWRAR